MLKVTKVRLYPTKEQEQKLTNSFGSSRWVYNHFLELNNKTYQGTGKFIQKYDMVKMLPELKKEYPWLKDTYSQCLQASCLNLSRAYLNFFEKRSEYPTFKSRHHKQSLIYPQGVKIKDKNVLYFPSIGKVKAKLHRDISGKIKTVTLSRNKDGKCFASILVEDGIEQPLVSSNGNAIGIDVGLTHFAITSNGDKIHNPKFKKNCKRIHRVRQKAISRKVRGSNNRRKAIKKFASFEGKIRRKREDFQHKLSRKLVDENQVIVVENLNIKGMIRNHCLAFGIADVSWGQFMTMLKYKAEREGKVYVEIDRFFPSSKLCSNCLNKMPKMELSIRKWQCPKCGSKHDRDINAAINIKNEGLRILTCGTQVSAYRQDTSTKLGRKRKSLQVSNG